ncbi:DNA primase [Coraliomargarita sp. SDUM461004]|uniref:DNA primase n=1 Tax=Thalassobacterium sedimentorum TaxID=3041258 RepID=A0ABU1AFM3_9BACT|nr:DNA primase [Coraliomargarita sp. SDUM461004]MDQ8193558.1 DNA primase [Coraliomargarita sp. SDUM461004]
MPRVKQSSIETIKHQVNLVDVVAPYAQLKKAGRSWKGLSPFTQEKTPSFYVHPDRGFYKCFSTGEGGDCFTFIMKQENLEFIEAVEFLAKKFNISLEYEAGGPSREEVSLRKQIFELHELVTTWFHQQFLESQEAGPVRDYWKNKRGFSPETAKEVKIGYAPAAREALALYCKERKISTAAMLQSGLFFARDGERNHENFKSRFRGRLMIPIRDVQGRVVAFTARQLPQTPADDPAREAKYVNSPETSIFHKGRILFGMDHARTHLKDGDSFLLVEGQLDAIRCWSVGLHTAVAPQGTAITDDQMHLLRRYEPNSIECLLDGDSAGRKAALRALPLAFKAGLEFRFLLLPEKADPDDLLREQGAEALVPLRASSKSGIELLIAENLPKDRPPSTHEKTTALRAVFELLHHVPSEVAREDYIQIAARLVNVDPMAALRDFQKVPAPRPAYQQQEKAQPASKAKRDPLLTQATWELLWLVLHHPEYANKLSEIIDYEWINTDSTTGRLLSRLLAELREGMIESVEQIENIIDTVEERQLLADIHSRELLVEVPSKQIEFCLERLRRNYVEAQIKQLEQKIINSDPETQIRLMRERKALLRNVALPLQVKL